MAVPFFDDCPHRRYSKGYKIPVGAVNYPASAFGHYLPGDEPGYYCDIDDGSCDECEPKKFEDCPRMEKTTILCPDCLKEDEEIIMFKDLDEKTLHCPECECCRFA